MCVLYCAGMLRKGQLLVKLGPYHAEPHEAEATPKANNVRTETPYPYLFFLMAFFILELLQHVIFIHGSISARTGIITRDGQPPINCMMSQATQVSPMLAQRPCQCHITTLC